MKKILEFSSENFPFLVVKFSISSTERKKSVTPIKIYKELLTYDILNRRVFLMQCNQLPLPQQAL